MPSINPYIQFNGNAEEAFKFYRSVFGGEFSAIKRFKELQSSEFSFPEDEANKIMHVALPIGQSSILMGKQKQDLYSCRNER